MNSLTKTTAKSIIAILFVITGATGLIYQIVWFKYLSLFLGNTTYAQTIVLATFLGGLATGNHIFGKYADSFKNPVRIYAFIELLIGIYCAAYPALSSFIGETYIGIASATSLYENGLLFNLTRLIVSTLLLLIPTVAMGGSLPVLSKFFIDDVKNTRRDLGILYFLNSFGAVWGIILAGFNMIKLYGIETTIYAAAIVNIIIGVISYYLSKKIEPETDSLESATVDETEIPDEIILSKREVLVLLIVAGLSGFASLLYEIVWVKYMVNFLGSSTYAFSIMLAAFISGITLGSIIVSQSYFQKFNKVKLIAACQISIAFSTVIILFIFNRVPYYLWIISSWFNKTESTFPIFLFIEFLIAFSLMIIPTIFIGMSLPLIVDVISKNIKKIGVSVGRVFSINTLGNVLGALISGLVLVSWFGIKGTFDIGIFINLFCALGIVIVFSVFPQNQKRVIALSTISAMILIMIISPSLNKNSFANGVFKYFDKEVPSSFYEYNKRFASEKLLYYKEGLTANVAVTQSQFEQGEKRLIINGKPDASSVRDLATQVLLAQVPMMLHPDPKDIFVVGLGSGVTVGSVLTHPVNEVVCSEISPEVIEAAEFFSEENYNCLNNKKLKLISEDAHNYLKVTNEKFDVIISEPSNPWIAGIGNLFSVEYFEVCKSRLNEDGIMMQWFHIYDVNNDIVRLVLSTFASVFDHTQLWTGVGGDILLVGSVNEISLDQAKLHNKFQNKNIINDFRRINIDNPFTFLSCQIFSERGFHLASGSSLLNTEIHPVVEFYAPKSMFLGEASTYLYAFDEKFDTLSNSLLIKDYKFIDDSANNRAVLNSALYHFNTTKNYRFVYGLLGYLIDRNYSSEEIHRTFLDAGNFLGINTLLSENNKLNTENLVYKRELLNELMKKYLNETNFLRVKKINEIADGFLQLVQRDTIEQIKFDLSLAQNFLQNTQYAEADSLCAEITKLVMANNNLATHINLGDYYYTYAMVSLFMGNYQITFENYMNLLNVNPNYDELNRLRRWVSYTFRNMNSNSIE
ncbi:MAG: fused MFS/spermidine synthase [Melioribacteraceae bacterium]|nr:fused MFS/spermidine synthase [Melioribacteraceae bacterium]MCF8352964.1 fused MFS/spermidine synthase [Melioribacteraceae bacterium]MCF8395347.1 fused MFS/spermidine synthase [Melioribacteraceae bacterium]MCF8417851.1 fused MFS/spermidine synthase [Melioribacteraceae bacterium]